MPDCPGPEGLGDDNARWNEMIAKLRAKDGKGAAAHRPSLRPIEMRSVEPIDYANPSPRKPEQQIWIRATGSIAELAKSDTQPLHHAVLAYASDFNLMGTSLLPHDISIMNPKLQPASLDHCIWFHDSFRADEWLLYVLDSPRSSHARGFNRGSFYSQDGRLVASAVQEGLIRLHQD
ncbi:MAG: acyl-CoA thioesterase, partial [Porticoccaceae bacterium]